MYNSTTAHQLNDEVYRRGISIKIANPTTYSKPYQITNLEKILEKHSKQFGEPAVLAEWGQPFGGPTNGFKVQKKSDADKLLLAYKEANITGIYPILGLYVDADWCSKKRESLKQKEGTKFNLDNYLKTLFAF